MRVVVASDVSNIRDQVRQAALGLGLDCAATDCLRHGEVPAKIAGPAVLVLHIGLDVAAALSVVHRLANHEAPPILVICDEGMEKDLPGLIRGGAHAYLRPSHLKADLQLAMQELQETGVLKVDEGRTIAVTGAVSGVGVTTTATNLAFALAENNTRVALVQLEAGNDLALNLQLQPAYPLAELAAAWYRLDATLLNRRLMDHPAGVSILADGPTAPTAPWTAAAIRQVLVLLRTRFDFVIVDVGTGHDAIAQQVQRFACDVIVVTRLDLPAIQQTRHAIDRMQLAGVHHNRLLAIVNRYGQHQQIDWQTAQEQIGLPIQEWIPDDAATANLALNTGRPIGQVAPTAVITKSFYRLSQQWSAVKVNSQPVLQQVG